MTSPSPTGAEDVVCTSLLSSRPASPPRWREEAEALRRLARQLALRPPDLLQAFAEEVLDLCQAGSVGISLLEPQPDGAVLFRWTALAGAVAAHVAGGSVPRDGSPCGVCLDQNQPVLLCDPVRLYPHLRALSVDVVEALVVPLRTGDEVLGTLWVISHDPAHRFNAEDARLLSGLAEFAATAALHLKHTAQERAAAQALLRTSEERFAFALEAADGVGAFDWDVSADRFYCNERLAAYYSVDPQRARSEGLPLADLAAVIHPDDRQRIAHAVAHTVETRGSYAEDYRLIQPDQSIRWVHARGRCQESEDGQSVRLPGVVFDITERQRAAQILRASEALARGILDNSLDCIKLLDLDGRVQFINAPGQKLLGICDITPYLGQSWIGFWSHPTYRESAERALTAARAGEPAAFEGHFDTPDGRSTWWDVMVSAIPDQRGQPSQILALSRDITNRKLAQQQREHLVQELKRSNVELSRFSHMVAHDLQAPVRTIHSFTQLLIKRQSGDGNDDLRELILSASSRMQELISALLAYAKVGHGELRRLPVSSAQMVQDVEGFMAAEIAEAGAVIQCGPLPEVVADRSQLPQVFQNLVSNAIKYRREGVPPHIGITGEVRADCWQFAVNDNGQGIAPEHLDEVFEPLKRLHGQNIPGSGLGLALCSNIVERHGGRIWVESVPDQGSTFFFTICH